MRRRNLKQAFVGEGDPNQEGVEAQEESDEEIEFDIVGGQIAFVVASGSADATAIDDYKFMHAELILENGVHVTLGIHADTVGAQIGTTSAGKSTEVQPDLSTASDVNQGDAV